MDLSIIMINHNTRQLTEQAIQSILDSAPQISYEIILVDNSDRQEEYYTTSLESVRILSHVENHGFAHGCNIGASVAQGKYLLFLNSDTIIQKQTLDASVSYLQKHPKIGGLGVKVVQTNGELDHACKRGFPTPWNAFCYFAHLDRFFPKWAAVNGYRLGHLDSNQTHLVDAVTGAYLMMPATLYWRLGGFDETFFMYGEDLDLCWKIKDAGYEVVYYAPVTCIHLKGQSGRASKSVIVKYHFYHAMWLFYERYYQSCYPRWVTMLVRWAIQRKLPKKVEEIHD